MKTARGPDGSLSHGYRTDTKNISAVSKYFTTMPYRLDEVRAQPPCLGLGPDPLARLLAGDGIYRLRRDGGHRQALPAEADCRRRIRVLAAHRLRSHARHCGSAQGLPPVGHGPHFWPRRFQGEKGRSQIVRVSSGLTRRPRACFPPHTPACSRFRRRSSTPTS